MGGGLSDEVFARRHRTLRILLALHVPGLALLGGAYAQPTSGVLLAVVPVVLASVAAGFGRRSTRALIVAAGLAYCSAATIGLANGSVEAHYHVLVMIGFVALYQDWVPFVGLVSLATAGYVVAANVAPDQLFDAPTSQRAQLWAAVHIGFVLAEALAMIVFWRATEDEQNRATALASSLTKAELERTKEQSGMRESSSGLLENLARRNQLLLDRQLQRIDALEKVEKDPEALAELFSLDHLATRMRRNAESLLVLAGSEESRGWTVPIPLSEICRGAMAEVEDYARVDVALLAEVLIDGSAVGDIVHLIAELIENATSFSPPTARVLVSGNATSAGYVLAVTDAGIGMADADLHAGNATLGGQASGNIEGGGMLGLHVVARLAARWDLRVWLQRGQDSGLSAMIALPPALIHAGDGEVAPTAPTYAAPAPMTETPVVAPVEPPQHLAEEPALFADPVLPPLEVEPVVAAAGQPVQPMPLLPQQTVPVGADQEPGTPAASPFALAAAAHCRTAHCRSAHCRSAHCRSAHRRSAHCRTADRGGASAPDPARQPGRPAEPDPARSDACASR